MSPRQATLLTLLVIVGTVAVGLPAVTAQETTTETVATQNDSASGMGTQLTAFLQSNSAAANDTVENGMWKSAYNQSNGTERAELVTNRAGSLERRLERLQERNATLEQRYENGSLSEQAYVAQQSRLAAEVAGLQTAVNDTDTAAERAGVNDTALKRLKQNASKLSGQQVSSVARGIAGPPDTAGPGEQGPPDDDRVNRSDEGPPDDVGVNQSDRGPPDDAPDDSENETGESDGGNQGAGNGPEQGVERGNDNADRDESGTESGDSEGNGNESDSSDDTAGDSAGSDGASGSDGDSDDTSDSSGGSDDTSDGDSDNAGDGGNQGNDNGQGNSGGQGGNGGSGQGNGNSGSQGASWMGQLT